MSAFANLNKVTEYLKDEGYGCSYNRLKRACENGLLKAARNGGFARRTVDAYARAHLVRTDASDISRAESAAAQEPGAAEIKALAQAQALDVERERKLLRLAREKGELVEAEIVERELSMRAQAFRFGLEGFIHSAVPGLCARFGGDEARALELIRLVGGDEGRANELVAFMSRQQAEVVAEWLDRVDAFLDAYATGAWWTDEMAAFWEEKERLEGLTNA